jgi:hypothetical protein
MLLDRSNLLAQLQHNLRSAEAVDIAVAWAWPCAALDLILEFARHRSGSLRAAVGIAQNFTHPSALQEIGRCGQLRVVASGGGLFHPKLYLFHDEDATTCWVGSANLTAGGFQANQEVVHAYRDDGSAKEWFDRLWNDLPSDRNILEDYVNGWTQPLKLPRNQSVETPPPKQANFYSLARTITSWDDFIRALEAADLYWAKDSHGSFDVLGDTASWLNTTLVGSSIARRPSWDRLSNEDYRALLGVKSVAEDGYGLLGSMGGAGTAKNIFLQDSRNNLQIRADIRAALEAPFCAGDEDFIDAACTAVARISAIPQIGGAVATRLLTLIRPDRAISVNGGSDEHLAALTGLPRTRLTARNAKGEMSRYRDLLGWFRERPWYRSPKPADPREALLWSVRGALFDCFVYSGDATR